MAKRQGAEGFKSQRKLRKKFKNQAKSETKSNIERVQNTRTERPTFILACEGIESEVLYFKALFKKLKDQRYIAGGSLTIAHHKHTDPDGVLNDLLNYPNYQDYDYSWIVIDRDTEHTKGSGHTQENFNQAISRAKNKGVGIAYSNPCFEIWYLLHLEYRNSAIDRHELIKKLEQSYDYQKNKLASLGSQAEAIRNADRLLEFYQPTNPADDNPSTTVHELVVLLSSFENELKEDLHFKFNQHISRQK